MSPTPTIDAATPQVQQTALGETAWGLAGRDGQGGRDGRRDGRRKRRPYGEVGVWAALIVTGAVLGLSAPGPNQWYLVWCGLVPLLWLTQSAKNGGQAALRGWAFGTAYNLVYMSWYLALRPVFMLGTFSCAPAVMSVLCWVVMALHQGLLIGIFAGVARLLPLQNGWIPRKLNGKWSLPAIIALPLLWVLATKVIGNSRALLGVPWSQLEYSQYQQLALLQCTSVIGGIGLCALIVLVNTILWAVLRDRRKSLRSGAFVAGFVCGLLVFGIVRLQNESVRAGQAPPLRGAGNGVGARLASPVVCVSALQASMVHRVHKVDSMQIAEKYMELSSKCPPGVCVWPEWSLVCNFSECYPALKVLASIAQARHQSWICGVFDLDASGRNYNAVCALTSQASVPREAYHKRCLVPFGEFTPGWVKDTLLRTVLYGRDCKFEETSPGNKPVIYRLPELSAAPILCFENLYPDVVAEAVRGGAQLIVDCSNNSWFNKSTLSDQMVAFSVLRAVENRRPFVFATALGPSTIIDATGHIVAQAPREQPAAISASVAIHDELTWFTRMCPQDAFGR